MTALSADLTARVARLLPLLGSDRQGEVAATAAALTRVLRAAERDWHDLAQHVAEKPREVIRFIDRPAPHGYESSPFGFAFQPNPNTVHRERVARCQAAPGARSPWEDAFLLSIAQRLAKGCSLTAKQAGTLDAIATQLGVTA